MASVIKNPMILNSANYIYNFFIGINHKNDNLIKNSNVLEMIESDETVLSSLYRNSENEERYKNIADRLSTAEEKLNGRKNS